MTKWQPSVFEDNVVSWIDALPILLDPHIGGNFTTVIARFAARVGSEAIIYPSARNDSVVTINDDCLEYFTGWNLVDLTGYRARSFSTSDVLPDAPEEGGPPTRFSSGFAMQNIGTRRHVIYDEPLGAAKPILLLAETEGQYAGSMTVAGLERRVERAYWESWLHGQSRWRKALPGDIKDDQVEDAKYALQMLDKVFFPAIYRERRVMATVIAPWFSGVTKMIEDKGQT